MGSTAAQHHQDYPLYVAGQPVQTGEWLEVKHKYSQELYARVALADAETLEKAIQSATQAEAEMAALEPFQKQKILLHCVKRFNEIREELTEILIAEGGKPRKAAGAEVERLINTFPDCGRCGHPDGSGPYFASGSHRRSFRLSGHGQTGTDWCCISD
jgi:NAD-dependent aldehyde dehydrogenases